MASNPTASIGKILFKDYFSVLLLLACVISIVISKVYGISIFLLILWLPLLIRRVGLIKKTIETGEITQGILASKHFFRGEWTIWYVFMVGDQVYKVRNFVIAFKLPFREKDWVSVAYDRQKPQRAFLPVLYAARKPS